MQIRWLRWLAIALITFVPWLAHGQSPEDARTLELVDRLKDVIQRAERNRVDSATVNQLRDLVRRYDWPWRVRLLTDDFSDGDFTMNPSWNTNRGEFRVIRGAGLRSYAGADVPTRPVSSERSRDRDRSGSRLDGLLGGILRGVLEPEPGDQGTPLRPAQTTAEISTPVGIGNAFAVKVRMLSWERNPEGSRLEFGPYRGRDREWGYRLAYTPGPKPVVEILRLSPGRSAVVERYDGATGLEDGRAHQFELRRDRDGAMQVLIDGQELIRAVDKGLNDFFDGFTIVNGGGEYTFERIEVYGAEK